jgi:hypothetical protein
VKAPSNRVVIRSPKLKSARAIKLTPIKNSQTFHGTQGESSESRTMKAHVAASNCNLEMKNIMGSKLPEDLSVSVFRSEFSNLRQVAPSWYGAGKNTQLAARSRGLFHRCKTFVMLMGLRLALISRIVLMRAEEDIEVENVLAFDTDHIEENTAVVNLRSCETISFQFLSSREKVH